VRRRTPAAIRSTMAGGSSFRSLSVGRVRTSFDLGKHAATIIERWLPLSVSSLPVDCNAAITFDRVDGPAPVRPATAPLLDFGVVMWTEDGTVTARSTDGYVGVLDLGLRTATCRLWFPDEPLAAW